MVCLYKCLGISANKRQRESFGGLLMMRCHRPHLEHSFLDQIETSHAVGPVYDISIICVLSEPVATEPMSKLNMSGNRMVDNQDIALVFLARHRLDCVNVCYNFKYLLFQ